MKPSVAFPYHDPDLQMFPHLQAILPDLKALFQRAYICPPLDTRRHTALMEWMIKDDFFTIFPIDRGQQIGERFAYLYMKAAQTADRDEIIHLAYVDRLSFALQGKYREEFMQDVSSLNANDMPLIFQRSAIAWQTHPLNYREIEGFVTKVGSFLFGKPLDYAWCHLVAKASQLERILPLVKNPDLSMVAEMVLALQPGIQTKDVDWLAWEDPFILGRDAEELKHEREKSSEETRKRLAYAVPMVEALTDFSMKQTSRELK